MVHIDILGHHETLDKILGHVLTGEKDEYNDWLLKYELKLDCSDELLTEFMVRLKNDKVVDVITRKGFGNQPDSLFIKRNNRTKIFLDSDGYGKLYADRLKKSVENDRMTEMKSEKYQLELEVLKLQKRELRNKKLYAFMGFIAGSVVTIGVALIPHVISHFEQAKQDPPSEYMTNDSPNAKIQPLIQSDTTNPLAPISPVDTTS